MRHAANSWRTIAALLATDGGHQLVRVQDVMGWVALQE